MRQLSRFDKSEIACALDDTVSTLVSGEDSGWFVDSDASPSLSISDKDEISRPHKGEIETETESSHSGKGQVAM